MMPQEESSENLYENIIAQCAFASIDNSFLASKGAVRASKSKLEAKLVEYKNEKTTLSSTVLSTKSTP